MSARQAPHSTLRAWTAGLVSVALVVGASGCSWRLEEEPVVYPSADQVTLERDAAAEREQAIIDVLNDDSDLAAMEAITAPAHLEALGGIYVATPSPTPSPSPYVGSLEDAVAQARDGSIQTAQTTTDANLAFLQSSIGLSHSLSLWWSTPDPIASAEPEGSTSPTIAPSATGDAPANAEPEVAASPNAVPESDTAAERILPTTINLGESFTPISTGTIEPEVFDDLAVAHNQARYLYEVIAARSANGERDDALARRDIHAARSQEFAALAGTVDGLEELYDVPPEDVADAVSQAQTARATEFALGAAYAAMLDGVAAEDRGWILNAAFDAYAAGSLLPGFTPDMFPVLPGVQPAA